tara:strand:- start:513 stop:725 length:213 start_codon:yes stop_codon:yes gene_type:complete
MNEEKLTKEQEYCKAQISDLMQKQANLNFQLDQVKASLSVFNNLMAEETKKVSEEVIKKEEKSEDTKGGK